MSGPSSSQAAGDPLTGLDVRLWGKSPSPDRKLSRPYPLICHLLDTAAIAGAVFDRVLGRRRGEWLAEVVGVPGEDIRGLVMFWAGLHDIGKISPPFQSKEPVLFAAVAADGRYIAEAMSDGDRAFHHSQASQWILAQLFAESGYAVPTGPYADAAASYAHRVAQMLGGHHGRFHARLDLTEVHRPRMPERSASLGTGEWERQARLHVSALRELVGQGASAVPDGVLRGEAVAVLTGLVVCADWLASQEAYINMPGRLPLADWRATPEDVRGHWRRAVADSEEVVREAGLGRAHFKAVPPGCDGFRERFPKIAEPNPLQASLAERLPSVANGPGLLLITAPPGDGKTEASEFSAAHLAQVCGVGGLAFALPTMATSDAIFRRVRTFVRDNVAEGSSLALVHGMAWLSTDLDELARDTAEAASVLSDEADGYGAPFATDWLRGRRRGLHASFGAMTIDQLLAGVLPLKHNMLRLYGMSTKVVVIDEAHSYGPYMHSLLLELLQWLGAMRVPVVVMSATLAGRTAQSILDAYRRGCGHGVLPAGSRTAPYPGWVFLDAETGALSEPVEVGTDRPRELEVLLAGVLRPESPCADTAGKSPRERLEVLARLLEPLRDQGGCVLVCCNTVAEAQETYARLSAEFAGSAQVELLHARFQSRDRARITTWCEKAFGKPGDDGRSPDRPVSVILVATQIVEQSIDLDFDVVISDLAPIALLIQRAGRSRRHERGVRPAWTSGAGGAGRLIVLDPVDEAGGYSQPKPWGSVYFEALLRKTSALLRERAGKPISIPADVQNLVDEVYAQSFTTDLKGASEQEHKALMAAEVTRQATEIAERQIAQFAAIPVPPKVKDLQVLSGSKSGGLMREVDEATATTRLGADSARLVLVYRQPGGGRSLDAEGLLALPEADSGKTLRLDQIRTIMQYMVPAPGWWIRSGEDYGAPPRGWADQPLLRDLVLVEGREPKGGGWASISSRPCLEYLATGKGLSSDA